MTTLTIHKLDPDIESRLRVSAAMHGRSVEDEASNILYQALQEQGDALGLGSRVHQRFITIFGVDDPDPLDLPARTELARGVDFAPYSLPMD